MNRLWQKTSGICKRVTVSMIVMMLCMATVQGYARESADESSPGQTEQVPAAGAAGSVSGVTISGDDVIFADETVSGWHIIAEKIMSGPSLNNVSVDLGYTGVEVSEFVQEASEGCIYFAVKLYIEKTGGTEKFEWEKLILSDSDGNEYHRIDDTFLVDLGLKHMPGNDLNFGANEGWIVYEISDLSGGLTLSYEFPEGTFSCSLSMQDAIPAGSQEDTVAETQVGSTTEAATKSPDASQAETEGMEDTDTSENMDDISAADDDAVSDSVAAAGSTDAEGDTPAAENTVQMAGTSVAETDIFARQNGIDKALHEELENAGDFSDPTVIVDPYGASPLTAVVIFRTEEEVGGTITVKGKDAVNDITGTFEAASEHIVPVYGLYNGETTQVEMTLDDGSTNTLEITTEKQDLEFGEFDAQMIDADAYDYGKLTFVYPFGGTIYAVDSVGDIRWCYSGGGSMGVHPLKNGHLMVPSAFMLKSTYYKEGLQEIDLSGKIYNMYAIPGGQHHDFQEMPNGNLLVAGDAADLSSIEDHVVEIDRQTGEVVWSIDMKDLLPTDTGKSASMDTDGSEELDWCHNNSVWYDESTDRVLLSARHLDAIIAVNRSDKTLAWILGDPTGWEGVDPDLFFTPEGDDFEWQYAQHQVTMLDNGDIMLFDNGTAKVKRVNGEDRVTGDDVYSRAVVYRIDTQNMTIRQIFQYGKERGAEWYADWVSGAESQDGTADNLWITAGSHLYSPEEDRCDYYPKDMMTPGLIKSSIIDQVVDGKLVYELVISGDTYLSLAFRSSRIAMYGDSCAQDIDTVPRYLGSLGMTKPAFTTTISGETLPAQDWNFVMDTVKLSVNGTYTSEHKADEIGEDYLILSNGSDDRYYSVTQYKTESESGEGTTVSVNGWLSREGLEGTWDISMMLDGTVYATGYTIGQDGVSARQAETEATAPIEVEMTEVVQEETEAAAEAAPAETETTEAVSEETAAAEEAAPAETEAVEAAEVSAAQTGSSEQQISSEEAAEEEIAEAEDAEDVENTTKIYGFYERLIDAPLDSRDYQLISENDASSELIETDIAKENTLVAECVHIDQMVEDELASGNYSFEEPLVISNPYQDAPLTGLIVFTTPQECGVRVTVKGKTENADISGELEPSAEHRVPVVGLYPGSDNTVLLELLGEDGSVTESKEIIMTTDPLPTLLTDAIGIIKTSGDSAYQLTAVYGQATKLPFAYDCNGDIRWYIDQETGNYGLYMLSNGRIIMQDDSGYSPNYQKPQATNLYEMDYLGRYYQMYYVANGTHHEVIEKEPGGNLLVLTSSLLGYYEDEIIEIDRETGEIVASLVLTELFAGTYTDRTDWAHINTVSWQKEEDTILISCRNLHSVMKIGWTDHQVKWILADPRFWEGTAFEKYVLKADDEDFQWQYQQHTAYQLTADLDNDPNTVEISIFDNHTAGYREIPFYDDLTGSYLMVVSVNESEMTVSCDKNIEVIRSAITSSTIYDEASGHIFGMCGHIPDELYYGLRGMNYEIDYETEEILNQFSLRKTFYRASEVVLNYEDLASRMEVGENYIKGTLKHAVKTDEMAEVPEKILTEEEVSAKITGQVLYLTAFDHSISQVILQGSAGSYVYDIATYPQYSSKYEELSVAVPVPLQNLEPDTYEVICMYQDEPGRIDGSITIG